MRDLTLRFTDHKSDADYGRSAFNDDAAIAKATRLLWSFVKAVVMLLYFFEFLIIQLFAFLKMKFFS